MTKGHSTLIRKVQNRTGQAYKRQKKVKLENCPNVRESSCYNSEKDKSFKLSLDSKKINKAIH